jgi:serine/threonine-protein kinase
VRALGGISTETRLAARGVQALRGLLPALRQIRVRVRALAALAVALSALFLAGCGESRGHVVEVKDWTLDSPLGSWPVTLPAHLNGHLPAGRSAYTLRAKVPLPDDFRDRPLTLAMAHLPAIVALRVDGHEAVALDTSAFDGYRNSGPHRWRIAVADSSRAEIDLELVVQHTWTQSGWIEWSPRLSATPAGDALFLTVSAFNEATAMVAMATTLLMSFFYGVLYFLDRKRTVNAWHSLQKLFVSLYPAFLLGFLQPIFGVGDVVAAAVGITGAAVSSFYFVASAFELPSPNPAWWLLVCAVVPAGIFSGTAFQRIPVMAPIVVTSLGAASIFGAVALVKASKKQPVPFSSALAALSFPIAFVFAVPDAFAIFGVGDIAAGLRGAPLAISVLSMLTAVSLGRKHIDSLNTADQLNVELAGRVALLEEQNREIRILNDELRRQISARSQRLVEALSRLGPFATRVQDFAPGDVIDHRYRVIRRLGEGGMGTVYEVERSVDSRRFALKVLQGHRSGADLARLAREAEIASRIDHPNVVAMVDVDVSASGAVFVVMEYVDGASLADLSSRYGDAVWALSILGQIARGLAAMHAAEIVHRDLKPGNVLVARDESGLEVAKIADFGIAMQNGASDDTMAQTDYAANSQRADATFDTGPSGAENARTEASLTHTGQVLGTPIYMAPELAHGAKFGSRASDVYAVGVMAFQLVTGGFPSGYEALAHLRGRKSASSLSGRVSAVPNDVAALLDRCLSEEPDVRPTADELAAALEGADERIAAAARGIPAE